LSVTADGETEEDPPVVAEGAGTLEGVITDEGTTEDIGVIHLELSTENPHAGLGMMNPGNPTSMNVVSAIRKITM
jgi:hypothetical protein